jgi:hypothetical protein
MPVHVMASLTTNGDEDEDRETLMGERPADRDVPVLLFMTLSCYPIRLGIRSSLQRGGSLVWDCPEWVGVLLLGCFS